MAMTAIVADTSAFIAIFKSEAMAFALRETVSRSSKVIVPAVCLVELALLRRVDEQLHMWAAELVRGQPYELASTSVSEARIASEAAGLYGKGSGHRAQLNFGDCLIYAAAKHRNLPLLFVGRDFAHTDIVPALKHE